MLKIQIGILSIAEVMWAVWYALGWLFEYGYTSHTDLNGNTVYLEI